MCTSQSIEMQSMACYWPCRRNTTCPRNCQCEGNVSNSRSPRIWVRTQACSGVVWKVANPLAQVVHLSSLEVVLYDALEAVLHDALEAVHLSLLEAVHLSSSEAVHLSSSEVAAACRYCRHGCLLGLFHSRQLNGNQQTPTTVNQRKLRIH